MKFSNRIPGRNAIANGNAVANATPNLKALAIEAGGFSLSGAKIVIYLCPQVEERPVWCNYCFVIRNDT